MGTQRIPGKLIVDTNVPVTANRAVDVDDIQTKEMAACVLSCVEAIETVMARGGLILDADNEIFDEYRRHLSLKGQPGVGDMFLKWVHDHQWNLPAEDRVKLHKTGEDYDDFPEHEGLLDFDRADRKFIALAHAHPARPEILQALDSKWWGWKGALRECGIQVRFLCPECIAETFEAKKGKT